MKKSIKEIAELAGVSQTTVSLVLNNRSADYRISQETQKKVWDVVKAHKYTPNQTARGLRLQKTQTLGFVVPDLTNSFFSQLSKALESIARRAGYHLLIAASDDQESIEFDVIQNLLSHNIDGLIVASVMPTDEMTNDILNGNTPVVYIDRCVESDTISWVSSDNFQGAYDLTDFMCAQGGANLCYLGGTPTLSTGRKRKEGFLAAASYHGIPSENIKILEAGFLISDGYQLAKTLTETENPLPEIIILGACTLLEGFLKYFHQSHGGLPLSLKLGTFDDAPYLDYLPLRVASVRQNTHLIAQTAFDLIQKRLAGDSVVAHTLVPTDLIKR